MGYVGHGSVVVTENRGAVGGVVEKKEGIKTNVNLLSVLAARSASRCHVDRVLLMLHCDLRGYIRSYGSVFET